MMTVPTKGEKMSDYKPGTVARATVRGIPNLLVVRVEGVLSSTKWVSPEGQPNLCHDDKEVTNVRPLVVLDLEGIYTDGEDGDALDFVRTLRQLAHADGNPYRSKIAHAIADRIEAQTKPARIPEPGTYGVVRAKRGGAVSGQMAPTLEWLRVPSGFWYCTIGSAQVSWDELIDPVLVREGVA